MPAKLLSTTPLKNKNIDKIYARFGNLKLRNEIVNETVKVNPCCSILKDDKLQ